jgi:hypothetical protein
VAATGPSSWARPSETATNTALKERTKRVIELVLAVTKKH